MDVIDNELSSSVFINIDDANNIARFTVWDDNSCIMEAINIDSGEYIINERHEIKDLEDFIKLFRKFNDLLV